MNTYVALLRGINVGGKCKVEMKILKELFESLGYADVLTYINSGNVIFTSRKKVTSASLEKAFMKLFGFEVRMIVRDKKNILHLDKLIPKTWKNDTVQKTDIIFLWDEFDKKESLDLIIIKDGVDDLRYLPGALIWNIQRSNYGKSGMNKFISTKLYKHVTVRNVNTLRKLAFLLKKDDK